MTFLVNAAKYYKELPHQVAAWEALEASLPIDTLTAFMNAYRATPAPLTDNPLPVSYFYQNDNISGTGYRECFSSSCAMLANFHGKVSSDDEYNSIRSKYGDTTDTAAQVAALESLGLSPKFRVDGTAEDLKAEIDAGRPVAVGWLHAGPVSKPRGGGHWSVIIGYDDQGFIFNDPNGEASLVWGGYSNHSNGAGIRYSYKNWMPRWCVEGDGTGWYLTCHK